MTHRSPAPDVQRGWWAAGLAALLMSGTIAALYVDDLTRSRWWQLGLGALAVGVVIVATRAVTRRQRQQVWICVGIATLVELYGSVLWGVYHYRLGGIPFYVPPGHGVIYLAATLLASSPLFARYPKVTKSVALVAAGAWAIAGVSLIPWLGGRWDIVGAFFFIYFATFVLRTNRGTFFSAVFLLTSLLEICGTAFGDWRWAALAPALGVGVGNPPSVIAGAYCCLDALVLLTYRLGLSKGWWVGDTMPQGPNGAGGPQGFQGSEPDPRVRVPAVTASS